MAGRAVRELRLRLAARLLCAIAFAAVGAGAGLRLAEGPSEPVERAAPAGPAPGIQREPAPEKPAFPAVRFRDSRALGLPHAGRLVRGTQLPARGEHFATWDPILRRSPGRGWRRFATDDLVRIVLRVARRYAAAEPGGLPMLVGDLSRPRGGDFGRRYGFIGHSTHQNGLDVDVYYPRRDRRPKPPTTVAQVDRRRAQRLVDLFVAAGAERVLVGPNLSLAGPAEVVTPYQGHDNHLHVRIRNPRST